MEKIWRTVIALMIVPIIAQPLSHIVAEAQVDGLSPDFYDDTCPEVFQIVLDGVLLAIQNETRNAASLLRLHFHDCFVQGCDASILLAATATIDSERNAPPNLNSVRGYDIIDGIKASLEDTCPGVVSCADIIALAAFYSVVFSGGPQWAFTLGRRDSLLAANLTIVLHDLISPAASLDTVRTQMAFQNLSTTDLVALQGAHTIGIGRCIAIQGRIYNFTNGVGADPTINTTRLEALLANCPFTTTDTQLQDIPNNMDITTPTIFDNSYYQNLLEGNGLFQTDQELFDDANDTAALVELYATNQTKFFEDFAQSMINMGNLRVLTGDNGEVRTNCSVSNSVSSVLREVVNVGSEQKSEKTENVKEIESAVEYLKKNVKNVMGNLAKKELARMEEIIEEVLEIGHFPM